MSAHLPRRAAVAAAACLAVAGGAIAIATGAHGTAAASASATAAAAAATTTTMPNGPRPARARRVPCIGREHGLGSSATVASVTAGGFTVSQPGATFSYTTSSSTTYWEIGVPVSRSELAKGEQVLVRVDRPVAASDTTRAATEVDIVLPEIVGKVLSISGGQLTIQDDQGFWRTVDVSSAAYGQDGKTAAASALKVGEYVEAAGRIASDHTILDASAVALLGTSAAEPPPIAFGPPGPGGFFGGGGGGPGWQGGQGGPGWQGGQGQFPHPAAPAAAGGTSTT